MPALWNAVNCTVLEGLMRTAIREKNENLGQHAWKRLYPLCRHTMWTRRALQTGWRNYSDWKVIRCLPHLLRCFPRYSQFVKLTEITVSFMCNVECLLHCENVVASMLRSFEQPCSTSCNMNQHLLLSRHALKGQMIFGGQLPYHQSPFIFLLKLQWRFLRCWSAVGGWSRWGARANKNKSPQKCASQLSTRILLVTF